MFDSLTPRRRVLAWGRSLFALAVVAVLLVLGLANIAMRAQSHQVDEIMAAATSATREAENGPAFLAAIQAQTGIRPRVISGTE